MWQGQVQFPAGMWAGGEPNPGADVGGASPRHWWLVTQVLQRGARSTSRAPSFVQRGLAVWPLAASFAAVLLLQASNNI